MNLTQQTWKFENGTIPEASSELFHLRWSVFWKAVNYFSRLHHRCLAEFWIRLYRNIYNGLILKNTIAIRHDENCLGPFMNGFLFTGIYLILTCSIIFYWNTTLALNLLVYHLRVFLKYAMTNDRWSIPSLILQSSLTLSWRRPLSYRNQSIDLLRKSMDWVLYDNGLRHERVKSIFPSILPMILEDRKKALVCKGLRNGLIDPYCCCKRSTILLSNKLFKLAFRFSWSE